MKGKNSYEPEIIFVLKQDGEIILTPRRPDDYIPHPSLSKGESVVSAGIIKVKIENGKRILVFENKTGHFRASFDSLKKVEAVVQPKLKDLGFDDIRLEDQKNNP